MISMTTRIAWWVSLRLDNTTAHPVSAGLAHNGFSDEIFGQLSRTSWQASPREPLDSAIWYQWALERANAGWEAGASPSDQLGFAFRDTQKARCAKQGKARCWRLQGKSLIEPAYVEPSAAGISPKASLSLLILPLSARRPLELFTPFESFVGELAKPNPLSSQIAREFCSGAFSLFRCW